MTTNVPKGAGRASHAAKTKKHAQRTPLPEKGATSGVTKKVSAEPIKEEVEAVKNKRARKAETDAAYDALAEAPASGSKLLGAKTRGRKVAPRAEREAASEPKKRALAKKAPSSTAKVQEGSASRATPKKPSAAPTPTEDPKNAPSGNKAQALCAFAVASGWASHIEDGVSGSVRVISERDPERVIVTFRDNKLDLAEMPVHEYGSRVVKLRNVSAAKKVMETTPEDAAKSQPTAAVRRERKERERHEDERGAVVLSRRLPWSEDEEPTDAELMKLVIGRKLVWRNGIAGTYEEAHVLPKEKQKQLSIVVSPRNGKRVLNFASVDGGFRSVYVENLVQIR